MDNTVMSQEIKSHFNEKICAGLTLILLLKKTQSNELFIVNFKYK